MLFLKYTTKAKLLFGQSSFKFQSNFAVVCAKCLVLKCPPSVRRLINSLYKNDKCLKSFCKITVLGWLIFIQTNMVYHIRTRNLPYYGSGYDWSFFTISQPLHNRLPPQWKPFIFEQIAQSSHNSQHKDNSLSPGFKPRNWCYTSDQEASTVTTALSELVV